MRLLALFASVVFASPALADVALREDPVTHRRYYTDPEPEGDVVFGWTFTAKAAKDVDFERGESDGAYLLKEVDDGSNVINVLADGKTGRVIADLESEQNDACWTAGGMRRNYCHISVSYSSSSRLAIVVIDSKWYTKALRLYRLRPTKTGLQLQASADVLPAVAHDGKARIAQAHKREPLFQRDGMSLQYSFRVVESKLVKETKRAFEIDVELDFSANVPKAEDAFSVEGEPLHYRVRGKAKSSTLTVELR